ncbi:MAG: dTDP-4-dehydrorhamnose reductase [Bacteroidales bacterium]|nr:dTDP-4-dehydrorhamnose reductase [Bacteroidales bacterium]
MKILVTGANGQLGNEIRLLSAKYKSWQFIFSDIDTLDLSNAAGTENFLTIERPTYLINCAAYTAVDKAETDTKTALMVNASAPKLLAKLSKKLQYKLIHISTDYVFSGRHYMPYTEEDKTKPGSAYGKTKLQGEQNVMGHTDAIIIRTSWLYSKFGNNFVKTMLRLGNEKDSIGVVCDQVGSPTNAADLAKAILGIITFSEENRSWKPGIYHFSNEGVASWYDFACEIMTMGNRKCSVKAIATAEYPLPAPRPAYSVLNKSKIKQAFGIKIPYWRESLAEVVEYLKK